MPNVLITPTILDSFEFAKNAPASWKARATNDFVAKLRREKREMPAWVKKGSAFEDTVYRVCRSGKTDQGSENFQKVVSKCMGGQFQKKMSKYIEVEGIEVCLFGYLDVYFPKKITDIKTTLEWKGDYKYLKGWQHKMYTVMAEVEDFTYLVVEWQSEFSDKIQKVYEVNYTLKSKDAMMDEIVAGISDFFAYLRESDLWKDYYSIFSNNR